MLLVVIAREDHVSPSPTIDHSPLQPLIFASPQYSPIPSSNPPPPIHDASDDGMQGWLPCRVASRALTSVIQSQYDDAYISWGKIPALTVIRWFKKFGEKVAWLPGHDFQIRKIFESKGSWRLSELLMEARNKRQRPSWIDKDAWKDLERTWKKSSYKEISNRNKKNRASARGAVHTCRSISIAKHYLKDDTFLFLYVLLKFAFPSCHEDVLQL
ncbi:hypothetical protein RYX36_008248 [Vicia faba]